MPLTDRFGRITY